VSFLADIKGSIAGGRYLQDVLLRPARQGLWFFTRLLIITALVSAFVFWRSFYATFNETTAFLGANFPEIKFENGRIVNLPPQKIDHRFSVWRLLIDSAFVEENSVAAAIDSGPTPTTVCIGPVAAFVCYDSQIRRFQYPEQFSSTIRVSDLQKKRILINLEAFGFFALLFFLINSIGSGFLILLIAAMIAYKFRLEKISYFSAIKVGFYLISHQLLFTMLLVVLDMDVPWLLFWFIFYYFIYVNLFFKPKFVSETVIPGTGYLNKKQ